MIRCLLSAACLFPIFAAQVSAEALQQERAAQQAPESAHYNWVDDLAARLGMVNLRDEPEAEQITFIFHFFLDATVGVTVYNDIDAKRAAGTQPHIVHLNVSFIDLTEQDEEKVGDVIHYKMTTDIYEASISKSKFYSVAENMSTRGFYSETLEAKSEVPDDYICLDGAVYYIEARVAGREHLIARSSCHEGFSEDVGYAAALLALAKEKIPQIRGQLTRIENHIRGN